MEAFISFVWNGALFTGAILFIAFVIFCVSAMVSGFMMKPDVKIARVDSTAKAVTSEEVPVTKRKRAKEFAPIRKLNENQTSLKIFSN